MKTALKFLKWTGIVLAILIACLIAFVQISWNKKFDAPYPDIKASTDSTIIARGKHLAYGPAHCATCHMPMDKIIDVENGEILPLIGGWELDILPGAFRAPNLTPDLETGIGKLTDAEIARTLRYSVKSDGSPMIGFMAFQEMTDADLTAIISFLRSQPPVKHAVKKTDYYFLGRAIMALGFIKPEGPKNPPLKSITIDSTITYGKYLANHVSQCVGCHTKVDMKTGKLIGVPFAGGMLMEKEALTQGFSFVTPNLTPDPETGVISQWEEPMFVNRFQKIARVYEGSHMPWGAFSRMDELELKAIYRYLKSLEPVHNKIEKIVFAPGEKLPEY